MFNWNKLPKYDLVGNYRPGKIEKDFEAELFKYLRKDGYICYHPADVGFSYKFLDGHLVCPKGLLGWVELKKIKSDTFNVSQFEESQVFLMRELDKRNPEACRVGIYSIKNNEYIILRFGDVWNNKNDKGGIKLFGKNKLVFS